MTKQQIIELYNKMFQSNKVQKEFIPMVCGRHDTIGGVVTKMLTIRKSSTGTKCVRYGKVAVNGSGLNEVCLAQLFKFSTTLQRHISFKPLLLDVFLKIRRGNFKLNSNG